MIGLHFRLIPSSFACTSLLPPFAGGPLGLWPSGSTPAQPVSVGTPGRATPGSRGEHHHRTGEPAAPRGSGSCSRLPHVVADSPRASQTRNLAQAAQTSLQPRHGTRNRNANSVIYRDYGWFIKFFTSKTLGFCLRLKVTPQNFVCSEKRHVLGTQSYTNARPKTLPLKSGPKNLTPSVPSKLSFLFFFFPPLVRFFNSTVTFDRYYQLAAVVQHPPHAPHGARTLLLHNCRQNKHCPFFPLPTPVRRPPRWEASGGFAGQGSVLLNARWLLFPLYFFPSGCLPSPASAPRQ